MSTGSFNAWDQNLRESEIIQWSMGIQRELRSDMMLDVSYVGTRGQRLLVNSVNLNQSVPGPGAQGPRRPYYTINPNLVNVSYRTNAGDSKYESLQVRFDKRFSRGLLFALSYTYSSYLSDVGLVNGGGNSDIQNHDCVACNWGPTPDDFKHVLVFNHVVPTPVRTAPAVSDRRNMVGHPGKLGSQRDLERAFRRPILPRCSAPTSRIIGRRNAAPQPPRER